MRVRPHDAHADHVVLSARGEGEHRLVGSQEQRVAAAARQEPHPAVGLALVGFEAQRQLPVSLPDPCQGGGMGRGCSPGEATGGGARQTSVSRRALAGGDGGAGECRQRQGGQEQGRVDTFHRYLPRCE